MGKSFQQIPDWARLRERYNAFWRGEVRDGMILAHIQNPAAAPPKPEPWMEHADEGVWLDPAKLIAFKAWQRASWDWHTDLFPYCVASHGPNVFAGFAGGHPVFANNTVWHEQLIQSLDEADRIHFDPTNRYWRAHIEAAECFSTACAGKIQLGGTDFGGPADWLSTLMGTENFLIATIEQPDRMRELALRLARECIEAYDIVTPILMSRNDGLCNWMPLWSEGRMGTVQDDMAINFSPQMYAEVFLPAARLMAAHYEVAVLHWHDGCAQHLDTFLGMEEIDAIQYGHDPNTGSIRDHLGEAQKIQAAGKKLFLTCVPAPDVEFFLQRLDPHGLAMIIDCKTAEESRAMEDRVREWTLRRSRAVL